MRKGHAMRGLTTLKRFLLPLGHVRNKSKTAAFKEGVAIEMNRVWKDTVADAKQTVENIKDHKYVRNIKDLWYPGGRDIALQSVAVLNSTSEDAKAEKPLALAPSDSTPEGSEAGDVRKLELFAMHFPFHI